MPAGPNGSNEVKKLARKTRGGQPGNSNALKHGFYTKNYSLAERRGLQATQGVVLGEEIALLRVLIRRFAEQILSSQGAAPIETAQAEADSSRLSEVTHTWVSVQDLAVISEAMLRLGQPSAHRPHARRLCQQHLHQAAQPRPRRYVRRDVPR